MKDTTKPVMAIEVILDDSGSMQMIREEVIKGVNEFIAQLATAMTPVSVSITLFERKLTRSLIDRVPVYEAPVLRFEDYNPMCGYEDIAFCVKQGLNKRLANTDAFQKVLVVITDGLNSSPSMSAARDEIAKRMKEGWLVLWLGTVHTHSGCYNTESMKKYAKNLGIPEGLSFFFSGENFKTVMPLAAQAALRFSGLGDMKAAEFTAEERKKQL